VIIDFNYNKVLVIDEGCTSNPRIINISGGSSTAIPFTGKVNTGYLTPQGAVLGVEAPSTSHDSLYDFNAGNLLPIGPLSRGSLQAAGDYCIWTYGSLFTLLGCAVHCDSLFLRDLTTTTNHAIGYAARIVYAQTSVNNLQADGTIWYVDSASRMIKYKSNVRSIIMQPLIDCRGGELYASPVADSFSVAYIGSDWPMTVIQWNKSARLMSQVSISRRPWLDYQVNGKYLAYCNIPLANQGMAEIRLADTLGGNVQIAIGGRTVSYLEWLTRNGNLMYIINKQSRWLASQAGGPTAISSALGKTYYRDQNWYIAIGNTLYGLDLSVAPDMVTNDTLQAPELSDYQFKIRDFTDNYGPSPLIAVKITALPKHGILKKGNAEVLLNAVIKRIELDDLVYYPDGSAVTADTIRWNGSNGLSYTAADGMFNIIKVAPPAKPAITGVLASYCKNQDTQKIKINNLPADAYITAVHAKLNNTPLTVNTADSSFSFNVNSLASGAHTITVTFSNIAGAKDTVAGFNVEAILTPEVNVSANITNVVDLTNPVIITATNAAGRRHISAVYLCQG
jgi:hypothetical protein